MKIYRVKTGKLTGTNYKEIYKGFFYHYNSLKRKTKRRPYIRSAYFDKGKVFIELFLNHLDKKENFRDKVRRIRYFPCAIELIQKSRFDPVSKENPNKNSEILHRFVGQTKENDIFFVQIKEYKKSNRKWLISVFPLDKRKRLSANL